MTYLNLLHDLRVAINATVPLLLARYQTISYPGSRTDIKKDKVLTQLINKFNALQHSVEYIQQSIKDGLIKETDVADARAIPDKLLD